MEDAKKKAFIERLQLAQQNYAGQLPQKIKSIEKTWNYLVKEQWDAEPLRLLHRLLHSIAGSGGTFGLPKVGIAARQVESLLKPLIIDGRPPSEEVKQAIDASLNQFVEVAGTELKICADVVFIPERGQEAANSVKRNKGLVFVVEDDAEFSRELATQMGYYGHDVRVFATLAAFKAALRQTHPAVAVMNMVMPDGDSAQVLTQIQHEGDMSLPVVFMASTGDVTARLQAVLAGGEAFFLKPVNITELIDTLDEIVDTKDSEPFRIVIVDDSKFQATHFSSVLEKVGMRTCIVTDPLQVMETLENFRPDLILIDLYMPSCTGQDLAKVIRQNATYVGVPIVFLSAETNLSKQLAAVSLGGDDFLTKPIQPEHLVVSVTSRAKRSRILRGYMIRDSLTGLYNHTRTKEQLDLEVARAVRNNKGSLAFAMVDMDKFKMVNDTYGHPTGDRVIRSLARLLKQRLRRTDIVGRYGGEEFAIILPDTDGPTAERLLNELREAFAHIQHQHADQVFSKTFSCGIATFPEYMTSIDMSNVADTALYAAKDGGRNRVVLARDPRDIG